MVMLQRLKKFADSLGVSVRALESSIGASAGVISRAIKNNTDIQSKWVSALAENYHQLNIEWLLTGKGEMIKDEKPPVQPGMASDVHSIYKVAREYKLRTDRDLERQLIPLYEIEATAGIVSLFVDSAGNVPLDYILIPDLPKCDGAVHVRGDSMYPLLKSGDIILYKQVMNFDQGILWGEMYLIAFSNDGDEYVTVKYVQKNDRKDHITLVSHNGHHAPQEIRVDQIRGLALIKASIRYNTMG